MAAEAQSETCDARYLPRERLQALLDVLHDADYRVIGPTVRDGAIVFETVRAVDELPVGVRDEQAPGRYRLARDVGHRLFAWANGPQALKPLLFSPRETLWRAERSDAGAITFETADPGAEAVAVIGARACDLAGMQIQDRHFQHETHADPYYTARRKNLLVVAVNCTHPSATCFCASTGDGPRATSGHDIGLTELDTGFVATPHSERGRDILERLGLAEANASQCGEADRQIRQAAADQTRSLPGPNLRDLLFARLDHPRWDDVAGRCLSCGNCTAVCPTCFCHREVEHAALDARSTEHHREWDSCFTQGHSYIHGITIRADTRQRYRQWLTHKLGSWHDQFGRSGCVGCGRCIAWCPVGIDITEEAAALCGEKA